ncbi:MAG: PAS domain S-box protein [Bradyrhizobium sp.]|uniref:PAS domain-containing protein n=1 Tax=Bradyrhizobium sp. TaxID=376 RepID=UPI001C285155|nr:PAS domain S-box protein [Bradyrhizobium sp.]MBU6461617.1 PAS domain S-box protein [Pseudomonadota bacterium]MDE2066727.1 PAS domain S-box protein [Bradyrhizobium sp.]MDE2242489.1 PAS domain S-box protein [Bradyrhizobium sp.]
MNAPDGLVDALLTMGSDAIIGTNHVGIVNFWNLGATRIFGFSADEAIGQSLELIIPPNLRERHWEGFHRAMATGDSHYGHGDLLWVPAHTKSGQRISVEFTIAIVKDQAQRPAGVVAILRDVTKRFEEVRTLKRQLADMMRKPQEPGR